MSYEMLLGLHLNIGRIRWQRANEVAQGLGIAFSKEPLPKSYFDAVAMKAGDAERMENEENTRRAIEKAKHEYASRNF